MAKNKVLICPYCGDTQSAGERCRVCGGLFEPLSRQATHNAMGPWFVRDPNRPFQPGCSYETIIKLIERDQVNKYSILRGPTTKQFWTVAKRMPGIAHLLGYCHSCDASVDNSDHGCHACGVPFGAYLDRNFMGLPDIRPLPWEADPEEERREGGGSGSASRMMDFRRAAEPLGISSFASDEELRGSGLSPMPAYFPATIESSGGGASGSRMSMEAGTLPAAAFSLSDRGSPTSARVEANPAAISAAVMESSPAGAAARALQRKLEDQRRTIKTLAILAIVAAVLAVVVVAILLARGGSSKSDESAPARIDQSKDKAATKLDDASKSADPKQTVAAASPVAPATQPVASPSASPETLAEYAQVQELIAQAEQTDRAMNDRIHDYDEALKALKAIDAKTSIAQKPADLAERIKHVEKELERLKLQEFFP